MSEGLETKQVELPSVGLVLTLSQSSWRISRRKDKIERDGSALIEKMEKDGTPFEEGDIMFIQTFYPLIAGAVVSGNCPSWDVCVEHVKEGELDNWYKVARELNPDWFVLVDKISELAAQEEESETEIKKEKLLKLMSEETIPVESSIE